MNQAQRLKEAFDLFDASSSDEEIDDSISMSIKPVIKTSTNCSPLDHKPRATKRDPVLWPDHPPQYMGPLQYVDHLDIGGGRGYVAYEDIQPGTILLIESALVPWPTDYNDLFVDTVCHILERHDAQDLMESMAHIYPISLDDLPPDIRAAGTTRYHDALQDLASDCLPLDKLLQLVFAMQSNAFFSGIFLHSSIFNHSCQPNCVKFNPSPENPVSEVRASRWIRKGEPLTISYIHPLEQSLSTRQAQFRTQFGFTCGCARCEADKPMDEGQFSTLETQLDHVDELLETKRPVKALALALEIFADALEILPHDAMELMRIHKLVASSSAALLRKQDARFLEHVILFLRSSYELLELQKKYLNCDHLDLARTYSDISQGIQLMLAHNPEAMYVEFEEWNTFRAASVAESEFRKEHERLKRLYE